MRPVSGQAPDFGLVRVESGDSEPEQRLAQARFQLVGKGLVLGVPRRFLATVGQLLAEQEPVPAFRAAARAQILRRAGLPAPSFTPEGDGTLCPPGCPTGLRANPPNLIWVMPAKGVCFGTHLKTKHSAAWPRSAARCVVLGLIRSAATNETLRPSIASTDRTQSTGLHSEGSSEWGLLDA